MGRGGRAPTWRGLICRGGGWGGAGGKSGTVGPWTRSLGSAGTRPHTGEGGGQCHRRALGCWRHCTVCVGLGVGRWGVEAELLGSCEIHLGGKHSLIQVVGAPLWGLVLWAGPEVEAAGRGVLGGTLVVSVRGVAGDPGDLLLIPRAVMPPSGSHSPRWWWGPGSGCLDLAVLRTGGVSGLFSQVCGA